MIVDAGTLFSTPFIIHEPTIVSSPFVFNVPHAGSYYPADFVAASRLGEQGLRRSEDAFVDTLFAGMTAFGAPVMCARFPRAYLDVNREPYELEPRLFNGPLPPYANTHSARVLAGLGAIPRIVADGYEIYRRRLSVEEGLWRIAHFHHPYHAALRGLLDRARARFDGAILIDCHSMPSKDAAGRERGARPDVVLGNLFGASCSAALMEAAEDLFRAYGYVTARNNPYAGGFITEFYGKPAKGCHVLQVELNRALYMNEELIEPSDRFGHLKNDLRDIFGRLVSMMSKDRVVPGASAAE